MTNKKRTGQTYSFTLITLVFLLLVSCKKELTEQQKVFLDFAKQEDIYSGSGYYYDLDLHSNYDNEPIYYDSIFNLQEFKKEFQQNFQIVKEEDGNFVFDYSKTKHPIQFPHKISVKETKPNNFNIDFSIFIPENYEQFSLSKEDIGTEISKDGMKVTLLDIRNDGATLVIENTIKKHDYSYTDGIYKDREKENKKVPVGYDNYLFGDEYLTQPNKAKQRREQENGSTEVDFDRLHISVTDSDSKTIECEARIIDFRHYLWYRNHDMPYPEMVLAYRDLKNRYKEAAKNKDYKYNPLQIINIRSLGKMEQLNFFLRSHKGKVTVINLPNIKPKEQNKKDNAEAEYPYNPFYKPFKNLTEAVVKQELKTRMIALNDPNTYAIYASMPSIYSKSMALYFEDVYVKAEKNDSIQVANERGTNYGLIMNDPSNIINEIFEITDSKYDSIKGKVEIVKQDFEEKKYSINKLPKQHFYNQEANTLDFEIGNYFNEIVVYAFEEADLKTAIPYKLTASERPNYVLIHFKKAPKYIIARSKNDKESIYVPFQFKIPKKEVQQGK